MESNLPQPSLQLSFKEKRELRFKKICSHFDKVMLSPLICYQKINPKLFSSLTKAVTDYIDEKSWSEYYDAYFIWNDFIDKIPHVTVLLKPGQLLAFHNYHMLHGRYSYSGDRHLQGFYLSYEQWINMVNLN